MYNVHIGNYFSLTLIEVEKDFDKANSLTMADISFLVKIGIEEKMVESLRKRNENEYNVKLDYLLYCYNLYNGLSNDISRFHRIITHLSDVDFMEMLSHIYSFFNKANDQDRLYMINILCKKTSLQVVIDSLYSKVEKDNIFYFIMSLFVNKIMS